MLPIGIVLSKYYDKTCQENVITASCECKNGNIMTLGVYVLDKETEDRAERDVKFFETMQCRKCKKNYLVTGVKTIEIQNRLTPQESIKISTANVSEIKGK